MAQSTHEMIHYMSFTANGISCVVISFLFIKKQAGKNNNVAYPVFSHFKPAFLLLGHSDSKLMVNKETPEEISHGYLNLSNVYVRH